MKSIPVKSTLICLELKKYKQSGSTMHKPMPLEQISLTSLTNNILAS